MRKANSYSSKRAKGKSLENWLASQLRSLGIDPNARAMPGSGAFSHFKGDIYTKTEYSFECKNQENTSVWKWYQQASNDAGMSEKPVVVFKRNYSEPMALLSANHFLDMALEIHQLREEIKLCKKN